MTASAINSLLAILCLIGAGAAAETPLTPPSERRVWAVHMPKQIPQWHRLYDGVDYWPWGEPWRRVGGLELVLPWDALVHPTPLPDRAASRAALERGELDAWIARDLRTALSMGIDGFEFYCPSPAESPERSQDVDDNLAIIRRYFLVAEAHRLPVSLTLQLSHPQPTTTGTSKAELLARRLRPLLEATRDSPCWPRTGDGRLIVTTFAADSLAEGVASSAALFKRPDPAAAVAAAAEACARLEAALGTPLCVIWHLQSRYFAENCAPGRWDESAWHAYVEAVLARFPGVCNWFDVPGSAIDDWPWVIDRCRATGRLWMPHITTAFAMSKLHDRARNQRTDLLHGRANAAAVETDAVERKSVGTGLSAGFRAAWERAIADQAPLVSVVSWNDLEEGHHLVPEIGRGFAYAELNRRYRARWRGDPEPAEEVLLAFYHRHPAAAKGVAFDIPAGYPTWMLPRSEWERLRALDDAVELVAILAAPGRLLYRGEAVADLPAGWSSTRLPLTAGPMDAVLRRDGVSVLPCQAPDPITDHPFRTDAVPVTWSSTQERWLAGLYPGGHPPPPLWYTQGPGGRPAWRRQFSEHGMATPP